MQLAWLSLVLAATYLALEKSAHVWATQEPQTTTPAPKNASYWITMNSKIRCGYPIQVTIFTVPNNAPVTVTLSVTFTTYGEKSTVRTLLTSTPTEVSPGVTRVLQIDVPLVLDVEDNEYGKYKVVVVGQGQTLNFKHEGDLILQYTTSAIFITTDRSTYKPGHTVNFRALAIDPANLKVLQEKMDIFITDAQGNRIKQLIGVTGTETLGVVQDKLELAASTVLGEWEISVTVKGQTQKKKFTVDYYVLPKFQAEVKIPSISLASDRVHTITISAKYLFGKPVIDGHVKARVTTEYQYWQPVKINEFFRSGQLNSVGEFIFEINKKQLLNLVPSEYNSTDITYWSFMVEANVTEGPTKKVQSASAIMYMQPSVMQAQFLSISPSNFKPGLLYTAYLGVKKVDGTLFPPEVTSKLKVNFTGTYLVKILQTSEINSSSDVSEGKVASDVIQDYWHPRFPIEKRILAIKDPVHTVTDEGFAVISFPTPEDAISITIQANFSQPFEDIVTYIMVSKFVSPTNSCLQIITPTRSPKVGENMSLSVVTTEPVKQLTYQIFSKGIMMANGSVTVAEASKSFDFNVSIIQTMAPSISIFAFFLREGNGELVADVQTLNVDGLFQKNVSMSYSKKRVEPGEKFEAIINAEVNSIVFAVARDTASELIKNDSDITQEMVRDSLTAFDSGFFNFDMRYMFTCGWPWSISGNNIAEVLRSASLLFFTDGLVYTDPEFPIYYEMMGMVADKGGAADDGAQGLPGATSGLLAANRVRKNFIESLMWDFYLIPSNSNGEIRVPVTSPDAMTKWAGSVFSVHPIFGLSVESRRAEVTTFRKLFLSLDLPVSIVRNEIFCFTSTLFSYYDKTVPILMKFESGKDFKGSFVKRSGEGVIMSSENKSCADFYPTVAENEIKTSTFCFTPINTGEITLKVSALTNIVDLSDAVEQVITVKPEGVARSDNFPDLVNLTSGFWKKEVEISYPQNTVNDSQSITVNLVGNMIGSIFNNIRDLLKKPYGCGEQNMLNFAPSVLVLEFFFSTNTITPEVLELAKRYISIGYQTELMYEHNMTGGFSAFGNSDASPSTWLTAFVLGTFCKTAILDLKYNISFGLHMNDVIYRSAFNLISNQNSDGSFTEKGIVFHVAMQGGSLKDEALTAYSLIALSDAAEVLKDNSTALQHIQKSMALAGDFLAGRIEFLVEPYVISIVTYVLNKINHSSKQLYFERMEQKAITEDGFKFWKQAGSSKVDPLYHDSASVDSMSIETTAYALLTYHVKGIGITGGLPILRYLIQKCGPNGGFTNTQDTVIGLQALSSVLTKLYNSQHYIVNFTISYVNHNGKSQSHIVQMRKDTEFLLQTIAIPYKNNKPTTVLLTANTKNEEIGPSTILVNTVLAYNVKGETAEKCFSVSYTLTAEVTQLELMIAMKSLSENAISMAILEVEIPAGYDPDVAKSKYISRVDPYNGEKCVIYFNSYVIDTTEKIISIFLVPLNGALAKAEPRSITLSDYYKSGCSETQYYTVNVSPVCTVVPDGVCAYVTK